MSQAVSLRRLRDQHGGQSGQAEKGKLGSGGDGGGGRRGGVYRGVIAFNAGTSHRGMGRPAAAIARLGSDRSDSVHRAQTVPQ